MLFNEMSQHNKVELFDKVFNMALCEFHSNLISSYSISVQVQSIVYCMNLYITNIL